VQLARIISLRLRDYSFSRYMCQWSRWYAKTASYIDFFLHWWASLWLQRCSDQYVNHHRSSTTSLPSTFAWKRTNCKQSSGVPSSSTGR